jgi:hypothetical protein
MLRSVLHHPMGAETHNILPGNKMREAFQWGLSGWEPAHHQLYCSNIFESYGQCLVSVTPSRLIDWWRKGVKKRKDSAGFGDTASTIKGGDYLGARTRQPPTAQTIKKKLVWVRGVVWQHPDPILDCCRLCYIAVPTLFIWVQVHVWWNVHSVCVSVY